jgi:hypothetical protein
MPKAPKVPVLTLEALAKRWGCTLDEVADSIRTGAIAAVVPVRLIPDCRFAPDYLRLAIQSAGDLLDSGTPCDVRLVDTDGVVLPCPESNVRREDMRVLLFDVERCEQEAVKHPVRLRDDQRHKERCRAIAALIWEKEPSRTIEDMIDAPEITRFGQENAAYTRDTVRRWIKDLCPDRRPGRRALNSRHDSQ